VVFEVGEILLGRFVTTGVLAVCVHLLHPVDADRDQRPVRRWKMPGEDRAVLVPAFE
jgi:hypothetical protein